MVSSVLSGTVVGVEGVAVSVEVDLIRRLPRVTVVGLPANAVKESSERVRSAISAAGLEFPKMCVTVNLAPGDLRKEGTGLDLPIALGILAASGQIPAESLRSTLFFGELGLDGRLRRVRGALSLVMLAAEKGVREAVLPEECAGECAVVPGVRTLSARSLGEVVRHLRGEERLEEAVAREWRGAAESVDLSEVRGQEMARRALEIAAAGGHNLLMVGPPGVGKTMLASRLPTILPAITFEESLEVTRVHSVAGLLADGGGLICKRPFRAPHHTISAAGLLGSASLRPGEVSLAHRGVLFLDEFPEFPRGLLEQLRAPIEDRRVTICRAAGSVVFPASCTLVAAANPCPCGFLGHELHPCRCSQTMLRRYAARFSGPMLDRIDLHVDVEPLQSSTLFNRSSAETSEVVRGRVEAARELQRRRYKGSSTLCNAELGAGNVREVANASGEALALLRRAVETLGFSGRGHDRVLKLARTIADLAGASRVELPHVAEALLFRPDHNRYSEVC